MKVINRLPKLCGEYGEKRRYIRNVYIIKFMVRIGGAERYSNKYKYQTQKAVAHAAREPQLFEFGLFIASIYLS
jgi:hypothetical protein